MEEQLPYYEDRQQEAWEDYQNLEQQREDLHRQCLEQSLTISEANERIKALEDALNRYVAKFGNCGEVYDQAVAALEVKP